MEFSSKLLENAVDEVSRLPGIGKRTALRLNIYAHGFQNLVRMQHLTIV